MAGNPRVGRDLTQGPIFKTLLVFAIPMVLSNVVQQLYSMTDLVIIGQFVGTQGTVGVSIGSELPDLMTPIASAFAMGGQVYISQLMGQRKQDDAKDVIATLLTFLIGLSVIVAIGATALVKPIMGWLNCPEEALGQAEAYMIISAIGLPFVFMYNAISSILRGMGESQKPLVFVCVAAVINIFTDIIFVVVFKMEAAGTAIATVLSQIGSFIASFVYMYRRKEVFGFELKLSYFRIKKQPLLVMMKLGIPQLCKISMVRFSMLWVNANINAYGLTISAANSVGSKIQKFAEVFSQGVEGACGAMIGQNLGAKQYDRTKKIIGSCLMLTVGIAAVTSAICLLMPEQLFSIFTKDAEVIAISHEYFPIIVMHFFMAAITGTLQALVRGSGFPSLELAIGILDSVICRIGFSLLFLYAFDMGYKAYWWGTSFSRTIPAIICAIYLFSGKWMTRKLLSETGRGRK